MEKMGLKNFNKNSELNPTTNNISREIFINKFIEKFPKTKLYTLVKVNKYYNKKITCESYDNGMGDIIFDEPTIKSNYLSTIIKY